MDYKYIRLCLGNCRFTDHARREMESEPLGVIHIDELPEALESGEIIEDYPDDKYGPSCLMFGVTLARRPLHIQCSYPSRPLVKIITLYEPDPQRWVDFKVRRTSDEQ